MSNATRRTDQLVQTANYDPARDLADRYPDWILEVRALAGMAEVIAWTRHRIYIDPEPTGHGSERILLAHVIAHLDLHEQVRCDPFTPDQERTAHELAIARLAG